MEIILGIVALLLGCILMLPIMYALDWINYKTDVFYRVKYGRPTIPNFLASLIRGE
jgi:hypothetical protein